MRPKVEKARPEALIRLADGLDLLIINENEVLVQYGTRSFPSELLRDTDLTGSLGPLFRRLMTAPGTRSELLEAVQPELRPEAGAVLDDFLERGLLTSIETNPVDQYIEYTFAGASQLQERRVAVLGAGPVGARIVESLLRHGVQHLTLLDNRRPDHLWGAYMPLGYAERARGNGAAHEVLRDRLRGEGYVGVEAGTGSLDSSGIQAAVAASEFVVYALEQPHFRLAHLVNRFCLRARRPWLHVVTDGNFGVIGPLFLPPDTGCYNDYRTLSQAADPNPKMARTQHRAATGGRGTSFFTGLPAHADIVAGFASLAVVHYLAQRTSFSLGRALVIDFDRLLIDVEDVMKLPRCPVCGSAKRPYQPAFSAEVVTRALPIGEHV